MTMSLDELSHIDADITNALVENRGTDPSLAPELIHKLRAELGAVATGLIALLPEHLGYGDGQVAAQNWAATILRDLQTRAVSQVPYSESLYEPLEDHRD